MTFSTITGMIRQTIKEYNDDGGSRLAAALAYFALFSLTPLLVLAALVTSKLLGPGSGGEVIIRSIEGVIGHPGAQAVRGLLSQAAPIKEEIGVLAAVLSACTALWGMSRLFSQMKGTLNFIWDVAPTPSRSVRGIIWRQFLLFGVVMGIGVLFVASLLANAGVAAINNRLRGIIPDTLPLWSLLNFALAFAVITLLTGIIYRVLPDVTIHWRDVWAGAAFVAALFVPGQYLIGVYFARAGIGSAYGAAGSIIILLVWIYLSMQIFLLGAEFSQVYARSHGRAILPDKHAVQMLRETIAEHQAELDKIEREFDEQLDAIKAEAQTMTERAEQGKPSLPPRPLARRIMAIGAPIVSLITGIVVGIVGTKQQIGKKRRFL